MVTRREFLGSLTNLSVMFAVPPIAFMLQDEVPNLATMPYGKEIMALEQQLAATAGQFSWWLHNELRHYYGAVSEKLSRQHSDILLQHAVMDQYVLNTVSDWHNTNSEGPRAPQTAVDRLLDNTERYWYLVHLRAACLIKAGDIYREHDLRAEADEVYRSVLDIRTTASTPISSLQPYYAIAESRLVSAKLSAEVW